MRLLNTTTLELEHFATENKPAYAALSHTWGSEEVLHDDACHGEAALRLCGKKGLTKVLKSAEIAKNDGYHYIWIDTCCIDKSSSAELSEAINSMFNWYRRAHVCYAFLEDFNYGEKHGRLTSRWFSRGWTLQELIAPLDVQFYDSSWTWFGDRQFLSAEIARITKIDERILRSTITRSPICDNKNEHQDTPELVKACGICRDDALSSSARLVQSYSTSTKMSWAAGRETTRVEDVAYCLMGIFDVNMPLLYGEGPKAFRRLQEEIVRRSNDQTIFAWKYKPSEQFLSAASLSSLFASEPSNFEDGSSYHPVQALIGEYTMATSSAGIEIDLHLVICNIDASGAPAGFRLSIQTSSQEMWLAVLNCSQGSDFFSSPALLLEKSTYGGNAFIRRQFAQPFTHCHTETDTLAIKFDPANLQKRRIFLLEPSLVHHIEVPRTRLLFNIPHVYYRVGRSVPDEHAPAAIADFETLPVWWESRSTNDISMLVYGAASVLLDDPDSFFILWGIGYPKTDAVRLAFTDPIGWRSDRASPFCELYRYRDILLLNNIRLKDHRWVDALMRAAETQDRARRSLLTSSPASPTTNCTKRWKLNDGDSLREVVADMVAVEFLGRSMFRIKVTVGQAGVE
ncbi:hypothetical protein OQA88_1204 [Cercophora sp. LCS_1]